MTSHISARRSRGPDWRIPPMLRQLVIATTLILATLSCRDDGDAGNERDFPFPTGDFQVSTLAVDDRCLDGGLNLLFMPNGDDSAWQWPFPITLYDPAQLEESYSITLRDPFGEMEVTATQDGPLMQHLEIHPNRSVKLGEQRFGDCVVELAGHGEVMLRDTDDAEGVIFLELSDPRGDERCPADMPDRCEVDIGFQGTRTDGN